MALIPVFQFGIFADGDIDYFAGPAFTFKGRVTPTGIFTWRVDPVLRCTIKLPAFGEIVTDRLKLAARLPPDTAEPSTFRTPAAVAIPA